MKKLLSSLLVLVMLANCFAISAFLTETESSVKEHFPLGNGTYTYRIMNDDGTPAQLGGEPITFETVVAFPTDYVTAGTDTETGEDIPGIGGMVLGSHDGRGGSGSFGVYRGQPVLQWQDMGELQGLGDDDVKFNIIFDAIDPSEVYCGEPVHIAIVRNKANDTASCYLNGELRQTKAMLGEGAYDYINNPDVEPYLEPVSDFWRDTENTYVLGGDMRANNGRWFRGGTLYQVAVYSDMRSASEIAADATDFGAEDEDMLVHFDLRDCEKYPETVTDKVQGLTAVRDRKWISTVDRGEYAFSMAVIGDTQKLVVDTPENVHYLYDWLINNKEKEKIGYVIGLGDITDNATIAEYDVVVEQIDRLCEAYGDDFVAPRGNHDINSLGKKNPEVYVTYDEAFKNSDYAATIPVGQRMTAGSIANCYKTVNICGIPYLILVLDVTPTNAMLAWADGVVEDHPNHNVIVVTHAYLTFDGTTLDYDDFTTTDRTDDGGTDDTNNGLEIWENFVKKHSNISLVLSGHIGYDYVITSYAEGDNRNVVTQILSDHQTTDTSDSDGLGMVTMLYFTGDGATANVAAVSAVKASINEENKDVEGYSKMNEYFYESNQYSIDVQLNGTRYSVDGNDTTDFMDLLLALDEVVNGKGNVFADVNGDGEVSLKDVLRVAKYLTAK